MRRILAALIMLFVVAVPTAAHADTSDFTVDFDDRGKDSNESDGTDWGEDDGILKCGSSNLSSGAWHIWVREIE